MTFDKKYTEFLSYFNKSFDMYLNSLSTVPNNLLDAIKYSVNAGGKRVRPVLLFLANDILGGKKEDVLPLAIAIECIHTYSLIHDDLPALDNDDYRRGQLSNHKKFGEAMAILAGDALLNLAYETVLNSPNFCDKHAKSLKLLAEYAGVSGMIKGQIYDVFGGAELNNIDGISQIVLNKTAKLLTVPLLIASIFNNNSYFDELKSLGFKLGTLFQITDDILDATGSLVSIGKTPKKDGDKLNFVNLLGLEQAEKFNKEIFNDCLAIIKLIPNSDNLIELVKKVYNRKN